MAAYPAMPLFTDAYLADTRHLTTEEHGAYLLLLMCAWRSRDCALVDDDGSLARIVGLSPTKWRRMRPVLSAFFDIGDGLWRQGKLTRVHEDVAARVARNRASGAKGGRARALKQSARHGSGKTEATKTKTAAGPESLVLDDTIEWRNRLLALCGPEMILDQQTLHAWQAAGVVFEATIKPTIVRLIAREKERTGQLPKRLAYFRDAVFEAHASSPTHIVPQSKKTRFDPTSVDHWRRFLGDASSAFRGDYISQNWFIPSDHPEFAAGSLGPNPRFSVNPIIPAVICAEYAHQWHWQPQP